MKITESKLREMISESIAKILSEELGEITRAGGMGVKKKQRNTWVRNLF